MEAALAKHGALGMLWAQKVFVLWLHAEFWRQVLPKKGVKA